MAQATYRFEIDWADDNYGHAFATIPDTHVLRYQVEWGGNLQPGGYGAGVAVRPDGHLTLMAIDGRYWAPTGDNALTPAQLQAPHRWRLYVDNVLTRWGRAIPTLGEPMGTQVEPKTWRLEGSAQTALASYGTIPPTYVGTASELYRLIGEASGLSVSGPSGLPISGLVSWNGGWAELLNTVAELVGAWAVDVGSGVLLATPSAATVTTLTEAHSIARAPASGLGRAEGFVRTHWYWPDLPTVGAQSIARASESRYGRRVVRIPEGWFTILDLPQVTSRLQRWSTPPQYAQVGLVDNGTNAVRAEIIKAVPGKAITVTLPSPTGNVVRTLNVVSVTLTGGHGRLPMRQVRGLAAVAGFGEVASNVPPANAPQRPQLRLVGAGGSVPTVPSVRVTWDSSVGEVDVLRSAASSDPAEAGWTVVSAADGDGTYDDAPGAGWWLYALRRNMATGVPNQINVGFDNAYAPPPDPVPDVSVEGTTAIATWGPHLSEVDVARVRLDVEYPRTELASELNRNGVLSEVLANGVYQYRMRHPSGPGGTFHDWTPPFTVGGPSNTTRGTLSWFDRSQLARAPGGAASLVWTRDTPGTSVYLKLRSYEMLVIGNLDPHVLVLVLDEPPPVTSLHLLLRVGGMTMLDATFTGNIERATGGRGYYGSGTQGGIAPTGRIYETLLQNIQTGQALTPDAGYVYSSLVPQDAYGARASMEYEFTIRH